MILITGDSWGCGEWNGQGDRRSNIDHAGLSHYLRQQGHQVVNLSKGGGSNLESASRIEDFLADENGFVNQVNCVLVFQTEWYRDAVNLWNLNEFQQVGYDYEQLKSQLISRFYHKLSATAVHHAIKIYVIGGCSDTIWLDQLEKYYPGISVACQSWVNLLINGQSMIDQPVFGRFGSETQNLIQYAKTKLDQTSLEFLLTDLAAAKARNNQWSQLASQGLLCSDRTHPNRLAHKILFDYLITRIPEFSKL
jgi:hypothetical protein